MPSSFGFTVHCVMTESAIGSISFDASDIIRTRLVEDVGCCMIGDLATFGSRNAVVSRS